MKKKGPPVQNVETARKLLSGIHDELQRDRRAKDHAFDRELRRLLRKAGRYALIAVGLAAIAVLLLLVLPRAVRSIAATDLEYYDEADRIWIAGFRQDARGNVTILLGADRHSGNLPIWGNEPAQALVKDLVSGARIEAQAIRRPQPGGGEAFEINDPYLKVLAEGPANLVVWLRGPEVFSNPAVAREIKFERPEGQSGGLF